MGMYFTKTVGGILLLILSTPIGCARNQTFGDKMKAQGKITSDIGSQWNHGESMVKKAAKLSKESDDLARKSQQKKTESEKLMAEGKQLIQKSEIAYRDQFGSTLR